MAMIDPFPDARVRDFLSREERLERYLFALFSAQRATIMAGDAVGGLLELDRGVAVTTLEACWCAASTAEFDPLNPYRDQLWSRMVPDDDDAYTAGWVFGSR